MNVIVALTDYNAVLPALAVGIAKREERSRVLWIMLTAAQLHASAFFRKRDDGQNPGVHHLLQYGVHDGRCMLRGNIWKLRQQPGRYMTVYVDVSITR